MTFLAVAMFLPALSISSCNVKNEENMSLVRNVSRAHAHGPTTLDFAGSGWPLRLCRAMQSMLKACCAALRVYAVLRGVLVAIQVEAVRSFPGEGDVLLTPSLVKKSSCWRHLKIELNPNCGPDGGSLSKWETSWLH